MVNWEELEDEEPEEVPVKFGIDDELEKQANEWLSRGVGENKRCEERLREKMIYECGLISADELSLYDPVNDWRTCDSAFSIYVDPRDLEGFEPSICADMDDGNTRAKNPARQERAALMRHTGENSNWGSSREEIPLLGVNDGERKTCIKCGRSKGLEHFYAQSRNKDGLSSWCKLCQKAPAKPSNRISAVEWLRGYLTNYPGSSSKLVKDEATLVGISGRSLVRARKKLGVKIRYIGPADTTWSL